MGEIRDLTGDVFGRLTVIELGKLPEKQKGKQRKIRWLCRCSCGKKDDF